ncbi:MAG: response regulator [Ardenticatenales bacterium]|nr:response regulator [Ardenticatenales bacterium]
MSLPILIVDDSSSIRKMIEFTLRSKGYPVLAVEDGQAALELLGREAIRLIILDVNMPRLDGLSLLRLVREHPEWGALPVLMLTTEDQPADRERAMEIGASDYLPKPFKPTQLLEYVAALLDPRSG